ncbi:hypothetical protein PF005_g1450 [Phytophthora fragariae]|uniref:Uncharacterized protein n=1 Tax=Phytophthora fragariae TaxID=53985 RepID=A0A6A3ZHF5_9STRA|nr:hypothetical protein PF003_g24739 [Phytophthora fragariae]KAE8948876.1 hypothetical protein PF009_g1558 [Phytophthora fragariae]KAE9029715.1 hypothetical protein PF011_g942 [Phytophthora fragariae]KAE9132034.1 hypothetical protein PF010_g3331 [Phytophthora fragariae]KAE9138373.1 hypothetical protein PF007_g1429 [Phytophthora fragariae]
MVVLERSRGRFPWCATALSVFAWACCAGATVPDQDGKGMRGFAVDSDVFPGGKEGGLYYYLGA